MYLMYLIAAEIEKEIHHKTCIPHLILQKMFPLSIPQILLGYMLIKKGLMSIIYGKIASGIT